MSTLEEVPAFLLAPFPPFRDGGTAECAQIWMDRDYRDLTRTKSPAPSVYSYNSSRDGSTLLRELGGRSFNSKNDLYPLPADEPEFSRLDKQHLMLLLAIGGLYLAKEQVRRALAANGEQKNVLDLGTGGGNWAIGMAQEFPHANVIGVDLAPSTTRPPPPNCRFEFDDVNLGLPHYYGMFDVVHARSAANGLRDYEEFIEETVRCLKPGGILLLVEGDLILCGDDKLAHPLALDDGSGGSMMARMLHEAHACMKKRGSSMGAGKMLRTYMMKRKDLVNVESEEVYTNIGPWKQGGSPEETQHHNMIGHLMRQNSLEFVRSLRTFLLSEGYSTENVDGWIHGTDKELADLRVHMYTNWHYAWAEKAQPPEIQRRQPYVFMPTPVYRDAE